MTSDAAGWVLAHQGGWDEILFVLLPIALFAGLLAIANRRATALPPRDATSRPDSPTRAEPEVTTTADDLTATDTDVAPSDPAPRHDNPDDSRTGEP